MFLVHFSKAQDQYLQISLNCESEIKSPFSKVHAIDNRADNQLLGYVQKGISNKVTIIKFDGSLTDSLAGFFINKVPAADGPEMVLMLNELFMHETDGPGRLKLSLRLFREEERGEFVEFLTLDSVYSPRGLDVTKKLLRTVNEQFCSIAQRALEIKSGSDENREHYSLSELFKLDSLEKLKIPMYMADKPNAGIYKDYEHFKMNIPDISTEMFIDTSNLKKLKVFRVFKEKNRKVQLESEGVYAVSDGNILVKVTSAGNYCLMAKENFDFYYERSGYFAGAGGSPMLPMAAVMGGAIGASIVVAAGVDGRPKVERYLFRINHRRGNSVPITLIKK